MRLFRQVVSHKRQQGISGNKDHQQQPSEFREREAIPSYGVGLRFMVLESQRINMRLDYGRSNDSDAVYLSVGEAF